MGIYRIAERVDGGMVQTVRVNYDRVTGERTVTPISAWRRITKADRARWAAKFSALK